MKAAFFALGLIIGGGAVQMQQLNPADPSGFVRPRVLGAELNQVRDPVMQNKAVMEQGNKHWETADDARFAKKEPSAMPETEMMDDSEYGKNFGGPARHVKPIDSFGERAADGSVSVHMLPAGSLTKDARMKQQMISKKGVLPGTELPNYSTPQGFGGPTGGTPQELPHNVFQSGSGSASKGGSFSTPQGFNGKPAGKQRHRHARHARQHF